MKSFVKILEKIGFFLLKVFYCLFLQFLFPKKVLNYAHGWDTLHPFSKYSFGGVPRKKFLVLYRKMKKGIKISGNDYSRAEFGSLNPSHLEINRKFEREELVYKHFSFRKPN